MMDVSFDRHEILTRSPRHFLPSLPLDRWGRNSREENESEGRYDQAVPTEELLKNWAGELCAVARKAQ